MRSFATPITLLSLVAGSALALVAEPRQDVEADRSRCPAEWSDVAAELMEIFVDENGACTDSARQGIRMSFHDCFNGACDGSLILTDECNGRFENTQMRPMCATLSEKVAQHGVGAGDLIQLAAALGVAVCKGPAMPFFVGREDSNIPNPAGVLPPGNIGSTELVSLFASKGFSPSELVALIGSHSTGKNLAGTALDTTVSQFDSRFYTETANGQAPASVPADVSLSNATETSLSWKRFATNQNAWFVAFVMSMQKMGTMGNDISSLRDCSYVVRSAVLGKRRSLRA